jgi:polysaccharide biosynthesis protein PslH
VNVLYLTQRLPYAPDRGDRIRSFHFIEGLRRTMDVSLVSLVHDAEEEAAAPLVAARGVEVATARVGRVVPWLRATMALAGSRPVTHLLLDSPAVGPAVEAAVRRRRPDVVVAMCSSMAKFALRPPLDRVPLVLDMVDVDSEKWRSLSAIERPPRSWVYRREARVLSDFERVATARAVTTTVVNEKERAVLAALAPDADVRVVPIGIDLETFRPVAAPSPSETVVFCGVMNYAPNEAGAVWLARDVWPHVLQRRPTARLSIVGSNPPAAVRALARPGVVVTGTVPHTRDYLWEAAVAVAPIHTARGLQNKVLEALAAGVPVVATTAVESGLPPAIAAACAIADVPDAFAAAIVQWLDASPESRRAHAAAIDLDAWSWEAPRQQLVDIVRSAAR